MPAKKPTRPGRPVGPKTVRITALVAPETDRAIRKLAKDQPSIGAVLDAAFTQPEDPTATPKTKAKK